ncbi:MAG: hypothetical protein VX100_15565, partial [Pseudomonadota bacterium]|nr:hypothetical protein [Pseudomonadota bacterium]
MRQFKIFVLSKNSFNQWGKLLNFNRLLGSVDLCCSIFVLFERAFIAALDVWPSNLSEYRATMRKVRSK